MFLLFGYFLSFTSCKQDEPTPEKNIPFGWYIVGEGTAVASLDSAIYLTKMSILINEANGVERPQLHDIFMAVKAGPEGFNLIHSDSSGVKTLGPDVLNVVTETERTTDEPKVDFQRGTVKETNTKFTVPVDGLYHIAYDEEYNTIVIVPVYMGIIGPATPYGWSQSTEMTSSEFNLNSMTFTVENLELISGDFEFRYSSGWKVYISEGNVSIFSYFGGSIDKIVIGGQQITNNSPGFYRSTMTWTIGKGWSAIFDRYVCCGNITDFNNTEVELVGEAISGNQNGAQDDTSGWNWGNIFMANNSGLPSKNGNVYTWTWSKVDLILGSFRIRTKNGIASGGILFDVGYGALDSMNSSENIVNSSDNLNCNLVGSYKIILTIDAGNYDTKVISIYKL